MSHISLFVIIGVAVALLLRRLARRSSVPPGLISLPGPKGYPIIGSILDVPYSLGWLRFAEWGRHYGPIYQVNLAGTNHVWISSDRIARDLLSKRASKYSDRPHIPALLADNRTSGQYLPLSNQNDHWSRQRRFASQVMRASEKDEFYHYPELEAIRMCKELLDSPDEYNHILESYISRITCRLAWGHSEASSELKQRARELLIGVSPNGALGNMLPFVMSLPDWLSPPKSWERRRARTEQRFFTEMQEMVRRDMASGTEPASWMKHFLSNSRLYGFSSQLEGAYAVGMHGIAGALTIAAPMQTFCLAMCKHRQYLLDLQTELEAVCPHRPPVLADKPQLPFLRAVIKECIRWRPPVPTGIPHRLSEDDEYDGYFIPKGSVIHPLEWSISRDPEFYPDAEAFNPYRWLRPEFPTYKEPLTEHPSILNMSQFGYGRRTCQGQTVTEADLFVGIGSIAWMFDIFQEELSNGPAIKSDIRSDAGSDISKRTAIAGMLSPHDSPASSRSGSVTFSDCPTLVPSPVNSPLLNATNGGGVQSGSPQISTEGKESWNLLSSLDGTLTPPESSSDSEDGDISLHRISSTGVPGCEQEQAIDNAPVPGPNDSTLKFSPLLIAKPLPFKFSISPRSWHKTEYLHSRFRDEESKGSWVPERKFWGPDQGRGCPFGWGKV